MRLEIAFPLISASLAPSLEEIKLTARTTINNLNNSKTDADSGFYFHSRRNLLNEKGLRQAPLSRAVPGSPRLPGS